MIQCARYALSIFRQVRTIPRLLIANATVVGLDRLLPDHAVLCEGGTILNVAPWAELAADGVDEVIDAAGGYLAPGLIDLHFHGVHRLRLDNGPDDLAGICEILPRYGVTGFLPCICPLPKGEDAAFLAAMARVESAGTEILGFHLEGPFLTLTGALPREALGTNDPERVKALIDAALPYRAIFSVAPDLDGILDLLPLMAEGGTPVFMTHTAADVAQTQAAIDAGVRHATHFYDVFPVPPESEPGVRPCGAVEAALADPRVSVDFILDGVHVDPVAVRMALQCKGPDRVCLITDANIGSGLPPGRYGAWGGEEVEFACPGGPARLTETSHFPGALAGSGLTLDRAVRNAIEMLDIDLPQAVRMASANPAQVLGLHDRKGQVAQGFDADLVLLDRELQVQQTWIAGARRFQAGSE